jgi:hypothetical protein
VYLKALWRASYHARVTSSPRSTAANGVAQRGMLQAAPRLGALQYKQVGGHGDRQGVLRCWNSHRHGPPAPFDLPSRRAAALGLLSAAVGVSLGGGSAFAAAPTGVELSVAVKSVSRTRDTLRRLADECDLSTAGCADELAAALAPLPDALPVVAASATDFGRPQMDLSIAVFAFLDRAADGASYECVWVDSKVLLLPSL